MFTRQQMVNSLEILIHQNDLEDMKTKELIAQLQKEDPSGELEVYTFEGPILHIQRQPGFWNGGETQLIRDESGSVLGVREHSPQDQKVMIKSWSLNDILEEYNDKKLKIEGNERFQKKVEEIILKITNEGL